MPIRKGIKISKEDAIEYDRLIAEAEYADRIQYVLKIKLNGFYGALSNQHFKFGDRTLGESTTAGGRHIVTHQHRKVNELLAEEYDEFGDGIIYGDSVAGDTIIKTSTESLKIEELFTHIDEIKNNKEYCNRGDIKSLTFNEATQQNEYGTIKYVVRHAAKKQMYRIHYGNLRYIDVSEDHSLIGYANTKSKTPGQLVNVKPTEIGKNGINSMLLNTNNLHTPTDITEYPKELYILMGLVLGDGYADNKTNGCTHLSTGSKDKEEIVKHVLNPLIDAGWITSIGHRKNDHDINLHGAKLRVFLRNHLYDDESIIKKIPDFLYNDSIEHIGLFLNGLFTADGTVIKGIPRLSSITINHITGANELLKLCGIGSNFWQENTENSYDGIKSGTFSIILNVYDAVRFEQLVGFSLIRKHNAIKLDCSTRKIHLIGQNGYTHITPTNIEKIESPKYIYDIEVENTHMFYGNDILLHNTDSTYFHTFTDNTEDAREVGDAIADGVNKSFSKFMKESFLINDDFDGIIQCGREIVSKRGIFVMKKKYMLHLVDLDGYDVDKLKVMGLDTKRTTIPKTISTKLEKFIERLLKGESWDDIEQDIVDYKDELLTGESILDIGIPSGVNKIEEYTQALKLDPKTYLPGTVAPCIHYNQCRELHNDNESPMITSGMKTKKFFLKKKNGRFGTISLPTDMTIYEIPEWFKDFEIDKDTHMDRLVDAPINNVIKAIGEESPTKQSMHLKSLFEF